MSADLEPRGVDPEPTPEAELWRSLTAGMVAILGPKKGLRLLREMAETMAERAALVKAATPIRGDRERHAREAEARLAAVAVFRRELPQLLAIRDDR